MSLLNPRGRHLDRSSPGREYLFHSFLEAEAADDARSVGGEADPCSDLFAA